MNRELINAIEDFQPISLQEMDEVKLLNRTDTKFVFTKSELASLLKDSTNDYKVLTINNQRYSTYKTLYFDTPEHEFYLNHQKGKENRFKVRIRKYIESSLCFLEVKNKKKGRTLKKRIAISDFQTDLDKESCAFISQCLNEKKELYPSLWNSFSRITLVNQVLKERLTIDTDLTFEINGKTKNLPNLVIAEVKQERVSRNTPLVSKLKARQIRPTRMSKYCIGCVFLKEDLKYNSFKEKMLTINKLTA
ncbi:MAG: polyphosphate polymerase domain-containing protein [Crocinitomicaceae bacterium]|nr:polyphosphate polymerase domain-containing protein [Crocinitomicaceae bacterium]